MTQARRHFERVELQDPEAPPGLDTWPFTIPAVAQLVTSGGLEIPRAWGSCRSSTRCGGRGAR